MADQNASGERAKLPAPTAEQRLAERLNAVIDTQVRKDADRGQAFLSTAKAAA